MGNFKNLTVWKISKDFAVLIYNVTNKDAWLKDYGFRDQIRRASISIVSNIAEGDASGTDKNSIHYFYIARGSAAEVFTQATIAHEIGYLSNDDFHKIESIVEEISAKLMNLIKSRKK